jgi:hypothetical protein
MREEAEMKPWWKPVYKTFKFALKDVAQIIEVVLMASATLLAARKDPRPRNLRR